MKILNVNDKEFKAYGKVVDAYDYSELLAELAKFPMPLDSVIYEPSIAELEAVAVSQNLKNGCYGGMPIQVGFCNGNNNKLNAVEYHRDSEIDIAQNDLILLLGKEQDIEDDFTYDTAKIEAFFCPAGTAVELYATTLHYAPCTAPGEEGFRCVIVLPKDTNLALTFEPAKEGEEKLLTHQNKWLIAHEDAKIEGAFNGLKGDNITL